MAQKNGRRMPKKKKKKAFKLSKTALWLILAAGILVYALFQITTAINAAAIKTHAIEQGTLENSMEKTMLILRDEYPLYAPADGQLSFLVQENDHVRKEEIVGTYQNSQEAKKIQEQLEQLQERSQELKNQASIQNPEKEIERLDSQIEFLLSESQNRILSGQVEFLPALKEDLKKALQKKRTLSGNQDLRGISAAEVERSIQELEERIRQGDHFIVSKEPGMAVFYRDGQEQALSLQNAKTVRAALISKFQDKNLLNPSYQVKKGEAVLTLVSNHLFQMICEFTTVDAGHIKAGQNVTLSIGGRSVPAVLREVFQDPDQKWLALFDVQDERLGLLRERRHQVKVTYNIQENVLKIPKDAITDYQGKKGVFSIDQAGCARFKELPEKVAEDSGYIGIPYVFDQNRIDKKLNLYDIIISRPLGLSEGQKVR